MLLYPLNRILERNPKRIYRTFLNYLYSIIVMHERAEMAEQAREKIRSTTILVLDEFKQVLEDFDNCNEIDDEKRNGLRMIYTKMLGKLLPFIISVTFFNFFFTLNFC